MVALKEKAKGVNGLLRRLFMNVLSDDLMESVADLLMKRVSIAKQAPRTLRFYKSRDVKSPSRGTSLSAGFDFYLPNDFTSKEVDAVGKEVSTVAKLTIPAGGSVVVPAGVHVQFPSRYVLIAFNKSGVASKKKLLVGAQVIDADYQGELHINLHNTGREAQEFWAGDKLTQFILLDVALLEAEEALTLDSLYNGLESERGTGGFGSTGVA